MEGYFHGCSCIVLTCSRCASSSSSFSSVASVVFSVPTLGGQAWTLLLWHTSHGKGIARNKPTCAKPMLAWHCTLLPLGTQLCGEKLCHPHGLSALTQPRTFVLEAVDPVFLHGSCCCTALTGNLFPFFISSILLLCINFTVWARLEICCLLAHGSELAHTYLTMTTCSLSSREVHPTFQLHFSAI